MELTQQRRAKRVSVGEAGEIVVRYGDGGKPWPTCRKRPRLIKSPSSDSAVEVVILREVVVQTGSEFIVIVNVVALGVQCAGAEGTAPVCKAGDRVVRRYSNQAFADV